MSLRLHLNISTRLSIPITIERDRGDVVHASELFCSGYTARKGQLQFPNDYHSLFCFISVQGGRILLCPQLTRQSINTLAHEFYAEP